MADPCCGVEKDVGNVPSPMLVCVALLLPEKMTGGVGSPQPLRETRASAQYRRPGLGIGEHGSADECGRDFSSGG
jgi:hypothetical protein